MLTTLVAGLLALQFSSGVQVVEVYASVTGPDGATVEGLQADAFVVRDGGVVQRVQTFARGEFPLSVVLAIDRSFSMAGAPLRLAREAARAFLRDLRPDDQALVVAVGSEVQPIGTLSRDRAQQLAALDDLVAFGTTSLHDAIVEVVGRADAGIGRRAVILLSDGQDRYSRASVDDVLQRVRRSDVLVYSIVVGKEPSSLLGELATLAGARAFHMVTPQQLPGLFAAIGRDLRSQYLLGYPSPAGASGWREIDVRVLRPGAVVRARRGYVAR